MRTALLTIVIFLLVLGCTSPVAAQQPSQASVQAIRAELDRLKQEMTALETRLATLEGGAPAAPAQPAQAGAPTPTAAVPAGATGAGGPEGALPIYGNVNVLSKIFNPDVAVIGDFLGAAGQSSVEPPPALEMHEAETSLQAIVDPYARADFFLALGPEGIELEEGYITFPTLPGGLVMKVGKMRSAFGKVNTMHNHVLPWADRPLVSRNLVGGEEGIGDAGISVARLLTNPWMFLEATGEVYRGESALFRTYRRQDLTYVGHLRGYQDVSESSNLDFGGSVAYGHNDAGPDQTTRLFGFDATFRYRPLRRAIYRRLLARTELMWSRRSEASGLNAFGAYAATDYQFARRWFAGVRYDYSARAADAAAEDKGISGLLTFWPSEFSQVRGQYRRTRYAEGHTANELLFQFLFSIGAHGAHVF